MISAELVKQLRDKTGVGMMECKKALEEAGGDEAKAIDILRSQGIAKAQNKSSRTTAEGAIGCYVHSNGKLGALVALACETDFVARTDDFRTLASELAMHVAASQPTYLKPEDIPQEIIDREKAVYEEQLRGQNKPEAAWPKIIEGKLGKFYEDNCLLHQLYIKDDKQTIQQLITSAVQKMGENIEIKSFSRLSL